MYNLTDKPNIAPAAFDTEDLKAVGLDRPLLDFSKACSVSSSGMFWLLLLSKMNRLHLLFEKKLYGMLVTTYCSTVLFTNFPKWVGGRGGGGSILELTL